MENASKALLMAGGVLIGLLIITLAVYLFTSFGTTSAEVNKKNQEQQLVQFNTQYTTYLGRTDLTIYDVVTVANSAHENNLNYAEVSNHETLYDIIVKIENNRIDNKSQSEMDELIRANQTNIKYECTNVEYYDTTGRVSQVTFKRIT